MQGLNKVISTQLIFDDKNEKTLGTYFSKPSWRKFDILQALSSLNKTPRRSCFESEISFKKFLFLPRPKIFFWGKTLGTIFSFNIRNDAKIFMWLIKLENLHGDIASVFEETFSFLLFQYCCEIWDSRVETASQFKFCFNSTSLFHSFTQSCNLRQKCGDNRLDHQKSKGKNEEKQQTQ